jgi:aryl-alcohol dehydrogenase-like predicted oxidoreductase
MTFGAPNWGSDEETSRAIFQRYLDWGGNFVDTAVNYAGGQSEELLGKFLAETGSRDRLVLATKFTGMRAPDDPNAYGNGRKNIVSSLETSLRRLGTDYIDLYWLHFWDTFTPVEEVMSTFDSLIKAGKIRAVGFRLVHSQGPDARRLAWLGAGRGAADGVLPGGAQHRT